MIAPPQPPSYDELELLIKEARERQLRRRLLGAAALAIAAAIGLAIYAFTLGSNSGSPTASANRPGGVPPCRSSQLSASAQLTTGAGVVEGPVLLVNTSGSACALPAQRPVVRVSLQRRLVRAKETTLSVASIRGIDGFSRVEAEHTIAAGGKASVWVRWSNLCPSRPGKATFILDFGGGLQVAAAEDSPAEPVCALLRPSPSRLTVSRPFTAR